MHGLEAQHKLLYIALHNQVVTRKPPRILYTKCHVKTLLIHVSFFVRWTSTNSRFRFSFICVCPLCCQDDTSFDSSLSICLIFCQVDLRLALFFLFVRVPCGVKLTHLSTAACQNVSYFVRWTNSWLCFSFFVFMSLVLSR